MTPPRTRPEGCLTDFAFDRRLAGELAAEEAAAATAHLATCPRCSARAEALLRARDAFAMAAPALCLPMKKATSRRLPASLYAGLAMTATVLLFLEFRPQPELGTRAKGRGPRIDYYVSHADVVRHGVVADHVAPGDRIRFVVAATAATEVAILSVDGAKNVSVYYPSGTDSAAVAAGDGVALPESTTLDATLGDEAIYAVFCPKSFAVAPLRALLEAAPAGPLAVGNGCSVDVIRWRKDASLAP